ncbi:MAG: hypothetical protein IJ183_05565 [Prevotella sp.]|nr:hypothetical protein [Prevotella sp.]MBQ9237364.1 hypothetical protein [Prevotella sp.]
MKKFFIGLTASVLCGLSVSAQSTLGGLYQVITSTSDFAAGDTIIMVSYDESKNMYAMGTYNGNEGNAFYAINIIGTTTADCLPSTITLDAANTAGEVYEYRARIFRNAKDEVESIALQDVNSDYVYGTTSNTNLTLSETGTKWIPSKYEDNDNYPYNAVCLRIDASRYVSYTPPYGFRNYANAVAPNYCMRAYCYKKVGTNNVFRIGSTGYATMYYGSNDVELPDGLTAYTMSVTKEGGEYKLHMNNIGTTVPHGTGVIVKGTANTDYYPTIYSAAATTANDWSGVDGNMLHGTDSEEEQSDGDGYYFKLADHATKGVGFYWGAEDGAPFSNAAHKAYLFLPEELTLSSLSDIPFSLIEEDGITLVEVTREDNKSQAVAPLYNVAGQRMNSRHGDGLRITGGRKVMAK